MTSETDIPLDGNLRSATEHCISSEAAAKLAIAKTCPKWKRCSAPFCPILGGKHLPGERVCHYLKESVKPGGHARVAKYLPGPAAEAVIREGVRLMPLVGPLSKAVRRASAQGSRIEATERYLAGVLR